MSKEFPLPKHEYPASASVAIRRCWKELGRWRRFLIAIDGRDGVGKSDFSRLLAHRLNIPVYEGDEFAIRGSLRHNSKLKSVLRRRLDKDRPVAFDSIFASDVCREAGLMPDFLIRVSRVGVEGMEELRPKYADYETRIKPDARLVLPCRDHSNGCTMVRKKVQVRCSNCSGVRWLEGDLVPWDEWDP